MDGGRTDGPGPRTERRAALTGRCSVRAGGVASAAASVPRSGPTPGCFMRDDVDGVGCVAAPSARVWEADPRSPREVAPAVGPGVPRTMFSFVIFVCGLELSMSSTCARTAASLIKSRSVLASAGRFLEDRDSVRRRAPCRRPSLGRPSHGGGRAVPHNGPPRPVPVQSAFASDQAVPMRVVDVAFRAPSCPPTRMVREPPPSDGGP